LPIPSKGKNSQRGGESEGFNEQLLKTEAISDVGVERVLESPETEKGHKGKEARSANLAVTVIPRIFILGEKEKKPKRGGH